MTVIDIRTRKRVEDPQPVVEEAEGDPAAGYFTLTAYSHVVVDSFPEISLEFLAQFLEETGGDVVCVRAPDGNSLWFDRSQLSEGEPA